MTPQIALLSSMGALAQDVLQATEQERVLREFMCKLCSGALNEPVSAPCGHHFCRPCLEKHFQAGLPQTSKLTGAVNIMLVHCSQDLDCDAMGLELLSLVRGSHVFTCMITVNACCKLVQ